MQNTNVKKWSDKIALIQKCAKKETISSQLKTLGGAIAKDTSLSENDKKVLRKIWQDAFNACNAAKVSDTKANNTPKKASDINANTIIEKIKHIEGLNIEICGTWLWVSGDTKPHKDFLKETGLFWAGKKEMWYWRPKDSKTRSFKSADMGHIREKYGREVIKAAS